uniref:Monooxygenase n=1 Tax=Streptomyces sp. NBC_01401 TaxID=2903854 RepID=A0AAU3H630_9ACTN
MSELTNASDGSVPYPALRRTQAAPTAHEVDVLVIGAGTTGMYQLCRARGEGFSTSLLEAGQALDHAWHTDRPAAERLPSRPEVEHRLAQMVDQLGLSPHIRLGARVDSVVYDASSGAWVVTTTGSLTCRARFVVVATGALAAPPGDHPYSHALGRLGVRGREGLALAGYWADGPRTYLGVMTAGFPNFFFPAGPHGTAGHCTLGAVDQVDFVTGTLVHARERGCEVVEVGLSAEEEWTNLMNGTSAPLFLNQHVFEAAPGEPGSGSPARCVRRHPEKPFATPVDDDAYAGFVFSKAESAV